MDQSNSMAILVCGFHRSGTSMLARILHDAGIGMGSRLGAPHASNQDGHFEDCNVVALHDSILARNGESWQYDKATTPFISGCDWAALHLYVKQRQLDSRWGLKDPRLMLFSEYWSKAVPEARWVVIYRSPAECHESLGRRHALALLLGLGDKETDIRFWREPELSWRMWVSYHTALLQTLESTKSPVLVLSYQSLVDERAADALRAISEFVGVELSGAAHYIDQLRPSNKLSAPPLAPDLTHKVDDLWQRLGAHSGRFSDKRHSCIVESELQAGTDLQQANWHSLAERLATFSPQTTVPEKQPEISITAESPQTLLEAIKSIDGTAERINLLSSAVQRFPGHSLLWQTLAMAYRDEQCYAESATCLEQAAKLSPDNLVIWRQLSYMRAAEKRYVDALKALEQSWPLAVANSRMLAELCLQACQICLQMKDKHQASLYVRRAVELAPDWSQAQRIRDDIEGQEDAERYLLKLSALYQEGERDAGIVIPLAAYLTQFGRMEEAREITEAYLANDPHQLWVRQFHITALHGLGEHQLARKNELALWRDLVSEPHTYKRIMELQSGLCSWSAQDLQSKLLYHLGKIANG